MSRADALPDPLRALAERAAPRRLATAAVALAAYALWGLDGSLLHDNAIYLYSGQRLAAGVPPYVSIFDIKTPLTSFVVALGVWLAEALGADPVLGVRLVFAGAGVLTCVLLGELAVRLSGRRSAALLAALGLLAFSGLTFQTVAGPRPKVLLLLLEVGALLALHAGRFGLAGVACSLAALTWQPAGLLALVALVHAASQPRPLRRLGVVVAAGALPALALVAYFVAAGAGRELLGGALLIHLRYFDHGTSAADHVAAMLSTLGRGYERSAPLVAIGLAYAAGRLVWRALRRARQARGLTALGDREGPLLLSLVVFVAWSVFDFQGYPDWFPLLPFAALGLALLATDTTARLAATPARRAAGAALAALVLAGFVLEAPLRRVSRGGLAAQRELVAQVEALAGPEGRIVAFAPIFLALSGRVSPTPHVVIAAGIDRYMDATLPGGIAGWVGTLAAERPDAIVVAHPRGELLAPLKHWVQTGRVRRRVGRWAVWLEPRHPPPQPGGPGDG